MERNEKIRLSWAATISIVVVVTLLAYLFAGLFDGNEQGQIHTAVPMNVSASGDIKVSGSQIYYYDGTQLHALNDSGSQRWNFAAGYDAEYSATEYGVATWTGKRLSMIDSESGATLYTGELPEEIISAKVGGTYAAVVVEPEHDGTIEVLERNGRKVDEIRLESQTVLDYGFFSNNDLFWVLSVNTQGTTPTCSISTYRPGKMITGSIADTDQIVYKVIFHSSTVTALGLTYAKTYDYTCVEDTDARELVTGWYMKDYEETDRGTMMAFVPTDQTDGRNKIRDLWIRIGKQDKVVRFPFEADMLKCIGGRVYGFSSQYVMSIGPDDSSFATYELPIHVDKVLGVTNTRKAVMVSGNMVYLVSMP